MFFAYFTNKWTYCWKSTTFTLKSAIAGKVLWCYNPYCLLQSCSASQTLKTLLSKAQVDPRTSKLAALLHQRDHLIDGDLTANLSCGSLMSTVQKSLDENWQVCILWGKTKTEIQFSEIKSTNWPDSIWIIEKRFGENDNNSKSRTILQWK